jgi:serine/threonine-protein kinase
MGRGQAETDPPALGAMPTDSAAAYRIQTTAPTTAQTNSAYQATLDGNSKAAAAYLRNAAAPADKLTETPSSGRSLPQLGEWSRYELLGQLGQGGMGTVYKARDRRLGRIVAIKFIRDQDESLIERFTQEAQAQARIEHPNICKVYEVGEVAGKAYIAMQYVAGQPLDKLQRILTIDEKVAILATTAEAIEAAHQAGILHRDIKPANIMVQRDGDGPYVPVVMDFGLAREANQSRGLTESGAVLGTPVYMPPEQARGEVRSLDARSDVYSLGATLFELLTGEPPFADDTVVNVLFQVISREAPSLRSRNPGLPVALDTICARCLAKDKEQRYPSAKALA